MTQPIHPMLTKMAAAIDPLAFFEDGAYPLYEKDRAHAIDRARAAIQALLEPDEGMLEAGRMGASEYGHKCICEGKDVTSNGEMYAALSAMLLPLIGEGE